MKARVTNIQRFSLDDGPGIRTTVFLKGCSLRCPWCSNPENLSFEIQKYHLDNKNGIYGYDISLDDLYNEIIKDRNYFDNNGGITFSGGEALLQFKNIEPLLKRLKEENINICLETSLMAPIENLDIAIKYVDEYYIDIKLLNKDMFNSVLKGNFDYYINNVEHLFKHVDKSKITFRMPVTGEYTLSDDNIKDLEKFLEKYDSNSIEIFKVHSLGKSKYRSLDMPITTFKDVPVEDMEKVVNVLSKYNKNIKINKL